MSDRRRILVAMSGGVDSSTTAWLLKEEGHEVAGAFMSRGADIPVRDQGRQECLPHLAPVERARRVAEFLGVPFHVVDLAEDFELLVDYFCSEYLRGRTPNPCAICNMQIKFRRLLELADRLKMDLLATGHYARVSSSPSYVGGDPCVPPVSASSSSVQPADEEGPHAGGPLQKRIQLRRGLDPAKDQSYYLFALSQMQLGRSLFPLGQRTKGEVRELARKAGLPAAETEESQDICFVPDKDYARLVRERLGARVRPGEIVDVDGNVVGTHDGIVGFTVGQRRGVRVAMGEPVYVVEIDARANRVVVGPADRLLVGEFEAHNVNWVSIAPPAKPLSCGVQIRYNSTPKSATVTISGRFSVHVAFDEPQRAVTPGQCAVLYDGDTVLGGGWIAGK